LDEAQAEEIVDLRSVDLLWPAPIELIEGLEYRKAGEPHPPLDTAVFAPVGLAFDQPRQIFDVRPLFGARLLGQRFKVLEHIRQFEARQVRAQWIGYGLACGGDQTLSAHRHGPHTVRDPVPRSRSPGDPGGG